MNIFGYALLAIIILYVLWFAYWLVTALLIDEIKVMNKRLEETFGPEGDNNVN